MLRYCAPLGRWPSLASLSGVTVALSGLGSEEARTGTVVRSGTSGPRQANDSEGGGGGGEGCSGCGEGRRGR